MPTAGTRKIKRIGSHPKRGRMSATLRLKKPSTQKKAKRLASRKVAMKISATGARK